MALFVAVTPYSIMDRERMEILRRRNYDDHRRPRYTNRAPRPRNSTPSDVPTRLCEEIAHIATPTAAALTGDASQP